MCFVGYSLIGNTVKYQYGSGIYKIANWSHITNAHPIPGPGIIQGLKEVGLPRDRGLLLLAEMSSAGTLAQGSYSQTTFKMAQQHKDFVIGFIGQKRMEDPSLLQDDFIYLTPGVHLSVQNDTLGQQYRTPRQVILQDKCDVIIVGRGIYGCGIDRKEEMIENAKRYRDAGWDAYVERTL